MAALLLLLLSVFVQLAISVDYSTAFRDYHRKIFKQARYPSCRPTNGDKVWRM